jgi:thiol-disulfide isomerase/thioredoxin
VKDFKSKDLIVEDINGTRFRFPDILTHNKGKFIYVDFWASWCAPCVGGMEAAYKLRKELRNKNIVFIYLNIWDTRENWKDAVKKYGISRENGRNYLIINGDSSIFIRGLNLTSIPRMILYDKTGKLINADAPHPGDPMLKKILKQ